MSDTQTLIDQVTQLETENQNLKAYIDQLEKMLLTSDNIIQEERIKHLDDLISIQNFIGNVANRHNI